MIRLGLGIAEIIIILMMFAFVAAVVTGLIFLMKSLMKKDEKIVYVPMGGAVHKETVNSNEEKIERKDVPVNQNVKVALPQQHEIRYATVSDIVRCEASDNYTFFVLNGGERLLISKSLKENTDLLKPFGFMRSHQSHLVNPNYVKSWLKEDGGVLLLLNGEKIPVSKPNRDLVRELLVG